MKKFLSFFLIAVLLCLVGCQNPDSGKLPKYALIIDEDDTYQVAVSRGFAMSAEAAGASCEIMYAKTAQEQSAFIEEAVKKNVKAIALAPADETSLKSALSQAEQAGISVVSLFKPTDGAQFYINHADFETIGKSIAEDLYKLSEAEGQFAIVDTNLAAISYRPWVTALNEQLKDEKYATLECVQTINCDDEQVLEQVENLLRTHPDLKVIYSAGSGYFAEICKLLEEKQSHVRVVGIANPAKMKDLVGFGHACDCFYLWDGEKIGADAFAVLKGMVDGKLDQNSTVFSPEEGIEYTITKNDFSANTIHIPSVMKFSDENLGHWGNIY